MDFGSKLNTITLGYTLKISLKIYLIDIRAEKIDSSIFKTFKMVLASFKVENTLEKTWFF